MIPVRVRETNLESAATFMRPIMNVKVPAGFPSPADDYLEERIDLNSYLVTHPSATFYYWVDGNSMVEAGIFDGDLIVVDNSIKPQNNDIVLAVINGEMTLKQIKIANDKIFLAPKNSSFKPLELTEFMNFQVRGVVVCNVHFHKRPIK
jgi:DNA polymerase V